MWKLYENYWVTSPHFDISFNFLCSQSQKIYIVDVKPYQFADYKANFSKMNAISLQKPIL